MERCNKSRACPPPSLPNTVLRYRCISTHDYLHAYARSMFPSYPYPPWVVNTSRRLRVLGPRPRMLRVERARALEQREKQKPQLLSKLFLLQSAPYSSHNTPPK